MRTTPLLATVAAVLAFVGPASAAEVVPTPTGPVAVRVTTPTVDTAQRKPAAYRCHVGPRRTADGVKRFWVANKRCYVSPWFARAHRKMIGYGCTRAPYYDPSARCSGGRGFHHGVDLDMRRGTRIFAGVGGTVVTRGIGSAYGSRALIIRHQGRDYLLGHLWRRNVAHGDRVRKGQLVGRSGARGAPDGPHLHFEVRPAGGSYLTAVRPWPRLRAEIKGS